MNFWCFIQKSEIVASNVILLWPSQRLLACYLVNLPITMNSVTLHKLLPDIMGIKGSAMLIKLHIEPPFIVCKNDKTVCRRMIDINGVPFPICLVLKE